MGSESLPQVVPSQLFPPQEVAFSQILQQHYSSNRFRVLSLLTQFVVLELDMVVHNSRRLLPFEPISGYVWMWNTPHLLFANGTLVAISPQDLAFSQITYGGPLQGLQSHHLSPPRPFRTRAAPSG